MIKQGLAQKASFILEIMIVIAKSGDYDISFIAELSNYIEVSLFNNNIFLPDSLRPEVLVEPGVNTDIFGSHLFDGELLDFLDGTGSTVFETDSMQPFVEVNCVFAGDNLAHGGSLLFLRHFDCSGKKKQHICVNFKFFKEHFIHWISLVGSEKNILHFYPLRVQKD